MVKILEVQHCRECERFHIGIVPCGSTQAELQATDYEILSECPLQDMPLPKNFEDWWTWCVCNRKYRGLSKVEAREIWNAVYSQKRKVPTVAEYNESLRTGKSFAEVRTGCGRCGFEECECITGPKRIMQICSEAKEDGPCVDCEASEPFRLDYIPKVFRGCHGHHPDFVIWNIETESIDEASPTKET